MNVKNILNNVRTKYYSLKEKGFLHIIISSSLVKIVSFISAFFLPRFLSKADFGLLTYVDNIRGYILLFNALGIANATIKFCSKEDDTAKSKGYFLSSIMLGIIFDVVIIVVSIIGFMLVKEKFDGAKSLLIMTSFLPMFAFLLEDIQLFLRARFENKSYSVSSFSYALFMVIFQIGMAIAMGLYGVVIGRYFAAIASILLGLFLIRNIKDIKNPAIYPDKGEMVRMVKFGFVMMITNATSLIMQLNETFMISFVLKDEIALADYKVASYILSISLFVLQSIVLFIYPYFARHEDDKAWIWRNFKKIFFVNAIIMIPIHIILMFLTKPFIYIVFGEAYLNVSNLMRILLLASLAQSIFRGIVGNILAGIGEERYNLVLNIVFTVLHVIIDYFCIKTFGLSGAAFAITFVYFASGLLMILHLRNICKKGMVKI